MARTRRTDKTAKRTTALVVPKSRTLALLRRSIEAPKGLVNINTIDGLMKVNEGIFFDLANGAPLEELRMLRQSASDHRKYIAMMLMCGFDPQQFFTRGMRGMRMSKRPALVQSTGVPQLEAVSESSKNSGKKAA